MINIPELLELETKSKEELIELLQNIKEKFIIPYKQSLKISQKKYCENHKDKIKEIQARKYQKKCQDPEWKAEQSRKSLEFYYKKKNKLI